MKPFLNNIELLLSGAGVLLTFGAPMAFAGTGQFWQVAALTAVGVGLLHGLIFWTVRRRQRQVRERAILEIREMFSDVVKNQLAIINMVVKSSDSPDQMDQDAVFIEESMGTISTAIDSLSEESLTDWKAQYSKETLRQILHQSSAQHDVLRKQPRHVA